MDASRCAYACEPATKRGRRETVTSQFAESDVSNGDSFHTPKSAVYYTPPDARSLTSADCPIDTLKSQTGALTPGRMGEDNSQFAFFREQTQWELRDALLVERYTPKENVATLAELLDGTDVEYGHKFEERIAVRHLTTHTAILDNDFQIDQVLYRLAEEVHFRNANFLSNASPFLLDNVASALAHVASYAH